jgi:FtsP/CotA-like multicopper oxidase with cupredoxin domain
MDMDAMPMGAMDLNDINYDAYLANDRTLGDPEIIKVEKGGRIRLRVINGAASTAFMISTGVLPANVIAADGQPVEPLSGNVFPLTMGQRLDLIMDIPGNGGTFPILAAREGTIDRTGVILATSRAPIAKIATTNDTKAGVLDLALEQRLVSTQPPATRPADHTFTVHLTGDMATYRWGMMGADELLAGPGERVEISIMNMSMMAHPMHLHGHHFQVVGIDGKRFAGALRDTILVPPMKTVTIAFDAGNTGKWPFHCHHLYHMFSGMMGYVQVG